MTSGERWAPGGTQGFLRESKRASRFRGHLGVQPAPSFWAPQETEPLSLANTFLIHRRKRVPLGFKDVLSGCRTILRDGPKEAADAGCFQWHREGSVPRY